MCMREWERKGPFGDLYCIWFGRMRKACRVGLLMSDCMKVLASSNWVGSMKSAHSALTKIGAIVDDGKECSRTYSFETLSKGWCVLRLFEVGRERATYRGWQIATAELPAKVDLAR